MNDIKFKWFSDYMHMYYVPNLHDDIVKFKDKILDEFGQHNPLNIEEGKIVINCPIQNKEINNYFQNLFHKILHQYYSVGEAWRGSTIGAYSQNDKSGTSEFHTHIKANLITGLTYIDPPNKNEGGELEIWDFPYNPIKITPEKNIVYFFPSWLVHRPLPQKSSLTRISINWGYDSYTRPIHKMTGDRW